MTPLVAVLGLTLGLGMTVLWTGLRPGTPPPGGVRTRPGPTLSAVRPGPRLWRAAGAATLALVLTRWPVAMAAGAILGWCSPELFGGKAARERGIARTEAIAGWAEMLRDTISAANGLEAAIAATAPVAPEPIRPEVRLLAADLQRQPLPVALGRLADELAHPVADLVVAALVVAARSSVRELADLLGTLAGSARDEASMHLRVEAARARMRTAVLVITVASLSMAVGLVVLNPAYVRSYGTVTGQVVLAMVAGCWGTALAWLSSMSRFRAPARFLLAADRAVVA